MPPADDEEEFFGESVPTVVDAVVELSSDAVTRRAVGLCGHCGAEGCQPRGKCPSCGKIPQSGYDLCLGCEGPTLFLAMLAAAPPPRSYDEAERTSAAADGTPRCMSWPTGWVCVVMRELEA